MGVVGDGDERSVWRHILQPHYLPIGEELENKPDDGSQKTIIQAHVSLFVSGQVPGTFGGISKATKSERHVNGSLKAILASAGHPAIRGAFLGPG